MTLGVQIILEMQYLICRMGIRTGGRICEYPLEVFTEGMKSRWKFKLQNKEGKLQRIQDSPQVLTFKGPAKRRESVNSQRRIAKENQPVDSSPAYSTCLSTLLSLVHHFLLKGLLISYAKWLLFMTVGLCISN